MAVQIKVRRSFDGDVVAARKTQQMRRPEAQLSAKMDIYRQNRLAAKKTRIAARA
jgi:predicted SnoaL-like aldol condensation-catalyzing enzyme